MWYKSLFFARTFATAVRFSCNFILHNNYFVVVFLEKREVYYILETSVILFCLYWSLVLSALWFLSLSLVHFIAVLFLFFFFFFFFLLVLGTQRFLLLVPNLLVSVLVPIFIVLSFDFVLYARPGILFVFVVPHIELFYLAFFILFSIFKVFLCTRG